MIHLSDRVVAETGYLWANVGAAVCDEGAVLIDSPVRPSDSRPWQEKVSGLSPHGIRYLICTDYHGDHTTGSAYIEDVIRIAPQRVYREIEEVGENHPFAKKIFVETLKDIGEDDEAQEIADASVPMPHICFNDSLVLHLPPLTFEIYLLGGHSPACSCVYIPEEKILFASDVVINEPCPGMRDAHLGRWIAALKWIEGLPAETIVPGHGEICGKEEVRKQREDLSSVCEIMRDLIRQGKEKEAAVRDGAFEPFFWADTNRGDYWIQQRRETFVEGLEVVYDEIRAG